MFTRPTGGISVAKTCLEGYKTKSGLVKTVPAYTIRGKKRKRKSKKL